MENLMTQVKIEAGGGGYSDSVVGSFSSFQRRIEFHPARKPLFGLSSGGGGGARDFKLETLNPGTSDPARTGSSTGQSGKKPDGSELWDSGLDPELSFGITFRRIGAGLENLGNTCFLNSVLQCLTYTEPLAAYLQSGKHQNSCHIAGFCALCAIQKHVSRALQATGRIVAPKDLVLNLRCISRNFRISRQEDAHEYMVNLLESMHKCCLPSGVPSESPGAYEKSLVHKIFGGRLRSQVKCMQCSYCSNKFDPFLDLSLEIIKAESVYKALTNFTAAEMLDGGEKQYQCQRCKQKVRALKQLTVHKAPYVLTVHLKRFRAHDPGQKIDKKVQFGATLDMKPFVSGSYEGDLKYTLYGVLVHHGWSTHSGHYYCFVRTSSGMWYSLDDNRVVQVNERSVLEQKAYMLFYVRDRKNIAPIKPIDVVHKENLKANVIGNKTSSFLSQQSKGHPQSCPTEKRLNGAVNSGLSKETPVKEASSLPTNERILLECSVSKKDPLIGPSSSTPVLKVQSETLSVLNPDQGERLRPSAPSMNSKGDILNIGNTATTAASISQSNGIGSSKDNSEVSLPILSHCNGSQNSSTNKVVTKVISQKINPVSNGASSVALPRDIGDKTLEGVSITTSGESSDKMSESMHSMKSPIQPSCENIQNSNNYVSGNSPSEKAGDNSKKMGPELVERSIPLMMTNKSVHIKDPDCAGQRKLKKKLRKCKIRNIYIGLKFFKASIVLRKKKKHKKSKLCTLDPQNPIAELLLDKDNISSDPGPSKCEYSSSVSLSSSHSKKKAAKDVTRNTVKNCNGNSLMNGIIGELRDRVCQNGELRDRVYQNGALLATENRQETVEPSCSNDCKKDVLQEGMNKLTRGLEETTIARWDGIELHPQSLALNGTASFSIGYVPDEWDEEYDRGKRKKLRENKHSFGGSNPFQEIAAKKTQLKKAKLEHTMSGNRPFRI
ncbi:hypothetical protein Ddye_021936 [Dipteronia dyeriana]|uniref:Ubiquitin carboxyl-terminal hydrolase n=1 Tax=Dipteronia dyeriana TaxID=168575 RepID=A0AAD9WXC2_9ROSI|nr:hypothetical protein Ddye_021936 [Dipteronia dyeriana]